MNYQTAITIDRPAAALMPLMLDHARMPEWERHLVRVERVRGAEGTPGSVFRLVFGQAGTETSMTETIRARDGDHGVEIIYEMGGVWNRCKSVFTPVDSGTRWTMDVTFEGTLPELPQAAWEAGTRKGMNDFKAFAERVLP